MQITVLGAGAGGMTTAADLTIEGHEVTLFELPQFESNLDAVRRNGGIELLGAANEGLAMPATVTTDASEAIVDAELIVQVVPNFGYQSFAKAVSPHLEEGDPLVLTSANTLGALEYRQLLREAGAPPVRLGEAPSLAYNVRKEDSATVRVIGTKRRLGVAGLPSGHTDELVDLMNEAYPFDVYSSDSVLETSLSNGNPVIHPAGTLLNMAEIEQSSDEYFLYKNISKSMGKMMGRVDEERVRIADALEVEAKPLGECFIEWYDHGRDRHYATTPNALRTSPLHRPAAGPDNLDHRYIKEDVPYGLVPLSALGNVADVATPVIDSLIDIANAVHCRDYREEGRTLDTCGLKNSDKENIKSAIEGTSPSTTASDD